MKFTLSWLKQHLDTDATLEQICDGLVGTGLEVEGVEDQASALAAFFSAGSRSSNPACGRMINGFS